MTRRGGRVKGQVSREKKSEAGEGVGFGNDKGSPMAYYLQLSSAQAHPKNLRRPPIPPPLNLDSNRAIHTFPLKEWQRVLCYRGG